MLYFAVLDEADHTAKNSFTVCGLTVAPVENIAKLSESISALRDLTGVFSNADLLKFNTSERPTECSPEIHRELKNDVMKLASSHGVNFFAYCKFNEDHKNNDPTRNSIFGFNTILGKFNEFLIDKDTHGCVTFDRLDFQHPQFGNGFSFIREKFQKGNHYPSGKEWRPLERILSYSMSCEGTSHLLSMNDILTGGFRYLVNGKNPVARRNIQENLEKLFWQDSRGKFSEKGVTMRPYVRTRLPASIVAEYDALRSFLNERHLPREQQP